MNLYQALKVLDEYEIFAESSFSDLTDDFKEALDVLRAAARRRPMRIELDFTERAKQARETDLKNLSLPESMGDAVHLSTYFGNGEHDATRPEKRDPAAGRKAAKTLERYMLAEIVDLTK